VICDNMLSKDLRAGVRATITVTVTFKIHAMQIDQFLLKQDEVFKAPSILIRFKRLESLESLERRGRDVREK